MRTIIAIGFTALMTDPGWVYPTIYIVVAAGLDVMMSADKIHVIAEKTRNGLPW